MADAETPRPAVRVHAFALISAIGWLIDFTIFNLLVVAGSALFAANLAGAGVAVSLVFVAGRRFIFRDARTPLPTAVTAYVVWNVIAVLLASWAVDLLGRLLAMPHVTGTVQHAVGDLGLSIQPVYLIAPVAKVAVTPVTMYLNYLAMGMIIERRLRFW